MLVKDYKKLKQILLLIMIGLIIIFSFATSSIIINAFSKILVAICALEILFSLLFHRDSISDLLNKNKIVFFAGLFEILFILIRLYTNCNRAFVSEISKSMVRLIILLSITGFVSACYLELIRKKHLHIVFGVLALSFGMAFMLMLPVGQVPDEVYHYKAAYRVSDKIMGISAKNGDEGYYARKIDLDYPLVSTSVNEQERDWYWSQVGKKADNLEMTYTDDSMASGAKSYLYIVSGLGITVGRLLKLNTVSTLLLGRLFNFALYILLSIYAVKIIPWGKHLVFTVLMFPITIQQTMSYSYDSIVIALSMIILGESLFFAESNLISKKDSILNIAIYLMALFFIFPAKGHAYVMFFLMIVYVISHRIKWNYCKQKKTFAFLIALGLLLLLVLLVYLHFNPLESGTYYVEWAGEYGYTYADLLNNFGNTFRIVLNTINVRFWEYYEMMIVGPLGWHNIQIDASILTGFTIMVIFSVAVISPKVKESITMVDRCLWMAIFVVTSVGILIALLQSWTPASHTVIEGIQGRYFTPVFPLLALSTMSKKIQISEDTARIIPILAAFLDFLAVTSVV